MRQIKLMLIDDHAVVRTGLRMMLESEPDMKVVCEAESGEKALEKVGGCKPDVVVMDIIMPGINGIEATQKMHQLFPSLPILALTIHEDERYFFQMLEVGAAGYLPKRAAATDLISAIRTVHKGNVYLYPSLASALVGEYVQRSQVKIEKQNSFHELTPRQRQVLSFLAEGMSNTEIANRLEISFKTVARHRENIMSRLDLHSRSELVKYAIRKGLIKA